MKPSASLRRRITQLEVSSRPMERRSICELSDRELLSIAIPSYRGPMPESDCELLALFKSVGIDVGSPPASLQAER